jgi:hypothetical protein
MMDHIDRAQRHELIKETPQGHCTHALCGAGPNLHADAFCQLSMLHM